MGLLSMVSSLNSKPKICKNCKYFILPQGDQDKYGLCSMFVKEDRNIDYLIDGVYKPKDTSNYYHCSVARSYEDLCGIEGKKYKKKYVKKNNS
jgi:hypothetical protein